MHIFRFLNTQVHVLQILSGLYFTTASAAVVSKVETATEKILFPTPFTIKADFFAISQGDT